MLLVLRPKSYRLKSDTANSLNTMTTVEFRVEAKCIKNINRHPKPDLGVGERSVLGLLFLRDG